MPSFFPFSTGVAGYFHDISQYNHGFHDSLGIYMKIFMLFVFCTCKAHNFAETKTNLATNLKKWGSAEPTKPAFCKSWWQVMSYWWKYNHIGDPYIQIDWLFKIAFAQNSVTSCILKWRDYSWPILPYAKWSYVWKSRYRWKTGELPCLWTAILRLL